MGVQGLTTLLEATSRPRVLSLKHAEAADRPDNLLLVDVSAVEYHLVKRLGLNARAWQTTDWHGELYAEACRYFGGLKRAGLRLVLVADSAAAPGLEPTYVDRRRRALASGQFMPPTAVPVLQQAYADLGLQVERSLHSADQLLLAWARANAASLFAVLTADSDFYVYGISALIHVEDVVVDPRSVTLHVWSPADCWRRWAAAAAPGGSAAGRLPPLMQRAQVAAVLGNDASKDLRRRLAARRAGGGPSPAVSASSGGRRLLTSAVAVARAVLQRVGSEPLELEFFRGPPLSLKSFTQASLNDLNAVVQSYMADDRAAADGSAMRRLSLSGGGALPWVAAPVAERLGAGAPAPPLLTAGVCRGLGSLLAPAVPDGWRALQPVRRAALAAALGGAAPGAVYEYEVAANVLHQLVPAAAGGPAAGSAEAAAAAQWFVPSENLPDVRVVPAAAAEAGAALPGRQATPAATAAALAAAAPEAPASLVTYHALLLHAADPDPAAWDAAAVRELLLPGVPVGAAAAAALAPAAPHAAVEAEEDGEADGAAGAAAGTAAGSRAVDVGAALNEEDWNDIDAKDVVAKTRSSGGFRLMAAIQPWDPAAAAGAAAAGAGAAPPPLRRRLHALLLLFAKAADDDPRIGRAAAELLKRLAAACFPHAAAEYDAIGSKSDRKKVLTEDGSRPEEAAAKLRASGDSAAAYAAGWAERLAAFAAGAAVGGGAAGAAPGAPLARTLLGLARDAAAGGAGSPQWAAMQLCWAEAAPKLRAAALYDMWGVDNRAAVAASACGAPPCRYRHQQQLLDLVDEHLGALLKEEPAAPSGRGRGPPSRSGGGAAAAAAKPLAAELDSADGGALGGSARGRPLHVILSTPTGSGKTFTAVMLHLQVLRDRHPEAVLVYSVPTKQVLKRVGQECEAHGVVYWTAAAEGISFQVRRPYSVRTQKDRTGPMGAGGIREQLETCAERAVKLNDRGGGKPSVIIADIVATAALVRAAREAPPHSFYASNRLVLYLDEPNMGIHLNREVRRTVRAIMASAPPTTVLASATLPAWDDLPAWWRGGGGGASAAAAVTRVVITQEPYELPMSQLSVYDGVSGVLLPLSPLDLFDGLPDLAATLESASRGRVLLLRHFSPQQANQVLGIAAAAGASVGGAAAGGGGGGDEGDGDDEEDVWRVLGQDVLGLRSGLLEPELARLLEAPADAPASAPPTPTAAGAAGAAEAAEAAAAGGGAVAPQGAAERFAALKAAWAVAPRPAAALRDVVSKQGVTMIATLEPRRVALELAGRWVDEEKWAEERRTLRGRVREAVAARVAAAKARERAAKRGDEDGGRAGRGDDGLSGAGRLRLRPGLEADASEADGVTDDDTLVMLARGVAYAQATGVEPLVKQLYQQALLYIPERTGLQPPISVLVVDYSAVYGTDCPAVDTLVMLPDLGALLSYEDHQQFFGRLRRDGTVVYPSQAMLRAAVLGGPLAEWEAKAAAQQAAGRAAVEAVLAKHVGAAAAAAAANGAAAAAPADATAAAAAELRALARPGAFALADVGAAVLAAALRDVQPPAAAAAGGGGSDDAAALALLKAAVARLERWGGVRPTALLRGLKMRRAQEQARLVGALEELCGGGGGGAAAAVGAAGAGAAGPGAALWARCAKQLLVRLADAEVVEEEALALWLGVGPGGGGAGGGAGSGAGAAKGPFREAVRAVHEYLQEEEDEDEEDE